MDPLVSLHYYAPVCAIINLFFLPFVEGLEPFYQLKELGVLVLVSNAAVAFLLNVAAVFLVGVASSLVLTLSGVFKVRLWLTFLFLSFVFCLQVSTWILTGITCRRSCIVFFAVSLRSASIFHCYPRGWSGSIVLVWQHQISTFRSLTVPYVISFIILLKPCYHLAMDAFSQFLACSHALVIFFGFVLLFSFLLLRPV
jgi:hypothetical protein